MSGFVVDASVVVATLVVEADTDAARRIMADAQMSGAVAPPHLPLEVANALTMKLRRNLIDIPYRDAALEVFTGYEIRIDGLPDRAAVMRRTVGLADRYGLTIYDAAYLELAQREKLVLATLDGPLGPAAKRERVELAAA